MVDTEGGEVVGTAEVAGGSMVVTEAVAGGVGEAEVAVALTELAALPAPVAQALLPTPPLGAAPAASLAPLAAGLAAAAGPAGSVPPVSAPLAAPIEPMVLRSTGRGGSPLSPFARFVRFGDRAVVDGPTLRNGQVYIGKSNRGGPGGRGLFAAGSLAEDTRILYSGDIITAAESKARRARADADYIAQLGYRDDGERVDGRAFAAAIATAPNGEGRFEAIEDWANDAGPACMANQSADSNNAVIEYDLGGVDCLWRYCVVRLTRALEGGDEILVKYGSDTPFIGKTPAADLGRRLTPPRYYPLPPHPTHPRRGFALARVDVHARPRV